MDSSASTQTNDDNEPARKRMRLGECAESVSRTFECDSDERAANRVAHTERTITDPSPKHNPEEIVGIVAFLSMHDGFDGIMKYR